MLVQKKVMKSITWQYFSLEANMEAVHCIGRRRSQYAGPARGAFHEKEAIPLTSLLTCMTATITYTRKQSQTAQKGSKKKVISLNFLVPAFQLKLVSLYCFVYTGYENCRKYHDIIENCDNKKHDNRARFFDYHPTLSERERLACY